jgi:hypothetical protein
MLVKEVFPFIESYLARLAVKFPKVLKRAKKFVLNRSSRDYKK